MRLLPVLAASALLIGCGGKADVAPAPTPAAPAANTPAPNAAETPAVAAFDASTKFELGKTV